MNEGLLHSFINRDEFWEKAKPGDIVSRSNWRGDLTDRLYVLEPINKTEFALVPTHCYDKNGMPIAGIFPPMRFYNYTVMSGIGIHHMDCHLTGRNINDRV